MLAIRLPKEIEDRLSRLARKTGRTKTFYAREAILEHLDDLEDLFLAEERYTDIKSGRVKSIPLSEITEQQSGDHPRAKKELNKLDHKIRQRIILFLNEKIEKLDDPRNLGEPLKGSKFGEFWKYRIGDYRLICKIEDNRLVILVLRIGHRREVYR